MTILNKSSRYEVTSRDRALLTPLLYGPLTAAQLQRFNWQMERPFLSEKYLRRRLCRLSTLGLVHSDRRYAAEIENGPKVYQLTKAGFHFLQPDDPLPHRSFFAPIRLGAQHHTFALQETVSLLCQAFHLFGTKILQVRRDREIFLECDGGRVMPDAAFRVENSHGIFTYYIELDCGTEPVFSTKSRESLYRKIRLYDEIELASSQRFKVLTVFKQSPLRQSNFLDLTGQTIINPKRRTVFLATMLSDLQQAVQTTTDPLFLDHLRRPQSLPKGRQNVMMPATQRTPMVTV